jgi:hypothetical protein
MPLLSGDRAFGIIALQRNFLTREALDAAEKEVDARRERGLNKELVDFLVERNFLTPKQRETIERVRARFGRHCHSCGRVTFLLPGEVDTRKPCEHCGGRLRQRAPLSALAKQDDDGVEEPPTKGMIAVIVGGPDPKAETERARKLIESSRNLNDEVAAERAAEAAAKTKTESVPPPAAPAAPDAAAAAASTAPEVPGRFAVAGLSSSASLLVDAPEPLFHPERRLRSFAAEIGEMVAFPFRGIGLVVITLPALLATFVLDVKGATLGFLFSLLVYQAKTVDEVVQGERTPSARPGCSETLGLAYQPLVAIAACFVPAIVLFVLRPAPPPQVENVESLATVGPAAHVKSSRTTPREGANASDVILQDLEGTVVRLGDRGGRWLVLGLLSRSARDTTTEEVEHASLEANDLGRLAEAAAKSARDVDVAAVYVDPDGAWGNTARSLGYKELKVLRTTEPALPSPLADARTLPTVFILDAHGIVRREFDAGASDKALWAAIRALKARKPARDLRLTPLPSRDEAPIAGPSAMAFAAAGFAFLGALYWPMAILMVAFSDPLRPFRYLEGLKSIAATVQDYTIVQGILWGVILLILIAKSAIAAATESVEAQVFAMWWLGIAGTLALGGALGRFYLHNALRMAWRSPKTPAPPPAEPAAAQLHP